MTQDAIDRYVCDGEKAEPLGDGYYIIQQEDGYRFGSDAVGLAHFAGRNLTWQKNVLDLCSGCGIIGIMLAIKSGCHVTAVEIDEKLANMSSRSAKMNGINNFTLWMVDARNIGNHFDYRFDAVVCNPPYYKANSKKASVAPQANSEITITLCDVVAIAKRALKDKGALYMTHVTSRLDEVICCCRDNGLTVKELVINPNGKTFMLRAVRGGRQGMTLEIKEY